MSSTESTQRLGGFEIEALLGRGGSGEVGAKWMDRRLAHREAVRVSSAVARALAEIDPEAAAWAVFAAWLDDVEPVPRAMYFYVVLEQPMVFELGALYPSEEEARRAERELSQDLEELRSHERYSDIVHRDEVATRGAIAFARAEVGERGLALLLELSRELEREIRGRLAK